ASVAPFGLPLQTGEVLAHLTHPDPKILAHGRSTGVPQDTSGRTKAGQGNSDEREARVSSYERAKTSPIASPVEAARTSLTASAAGVPSWTSTTARPVSLCRI